jgi:hypothetical protein
MQQQKQETNRQTQQIVPQKVWASLTNTQQQQFVQTIEKICQQLTSRLLIQQEEHDVSSKPSGHDRP